jgi:hypothetical protein
VSFKVQKLEADKDEDLKAQDHEAQLLQHQAYALHALKQIQITVAPDLNEQGRLQSFNWEQHAVHLGKEVAAAYKPAGQPTLIPHVLYDIVVTSTRACPGQERSRRLKVQQLRYDIELLVNEKQVYHSLATPQSPCNLLVGPCLLV